MGLKTNRSWRWGAAGGVALLHLGAFLILGEVRPERSFVASSPSIIIEMVRPSPPPPPISHPAPEGGGGPAAASVVRPARPRAAPAEIAPPPAPVPEPPLLVGAAESPSPDQGVGRGGQGAGLGSGQGVGDGPGAGGGPPRLIRGPTQGELRAAHPREAFRRRIGGRATLTCRVRLDTRLEGCRIVDETPPGMGFGEAALAVSVHFRFSPPTADGAPVAGREVRVGVEWP